MKRTRVALYEFMPYGAPELIEAGESHLARALTTSMAGLGALFALALVASALAPHHGPISLVDIAKVHVFEPPPSNVLEPPTAPHATPARSAESSTPLPVPDATAPTDVLPHPDASADGSITGTGEPIGGAATSDPGTFEPIAPALGQWVYVDEPPAVVTEVKPVYPDLAREAGVEGTVRARVLVGLDGRVKDVHVDASIPLLDEAAVVALRQWVFTPALANSHPVMVWVAVPVRFRLH